jgi:CHAT domain-containing protein
MRRWHQFSFLLITTALLWIVSLPIFAQHQIAPERMRQGQQAYEAGQFEQALKHWQQAERAYKGDLIGMAGSQINQAQALSALGLQRRACKTLMPALNPGDHAGADASDLVCAATPTAIAVPTDATLPANLQATGLRNLGVILRFIGNLETSQAVLQQAWRLTVPAATVASSPRLTPSLTVQPSVQAATQPAFASAQADVLLNLGNTLRDLGNRDRDRKDEIVLPSPNLPTPACLAALDSHTAIAITYYQQAIACYQQAAQIAAMATSSSNSAGSGVLIPALQAQLNHLALQIDIQHWLKAHEQTESASRWQTATAAQTQALLSHLPSQFASVPRSYEGIFARINFARSLVQGLAESMPLAAKVASPSPLVGSALTWQTSEHLLQEALAQAQRLPSTTAEAHARGNLGWLYEQMGEWDKALNWTQTALNLANQLQASHLIYQWEWQTGRVLKQQGKQQAAIAAYQRAIAALQATRGDLMAVNPDAQFSLRDTAEPIYRELVGLLLENVPGQSQLETALNLIDALQLAELENFLGCQLSGSVQLNQVVDPQTAIMYPIVLRDRVAVIYKLPNQPLGYFSTKVPQAQVESTLKALQENLLSGSRTSEVKQSAFQVYQWLMQPLEASLKQTTDLRALVFVLDGRLRNIPMAVLYDGERYLVQRDYAIAIAPGLRLTDLRPLQRQRIHVLAAAMSQAQKVGSLRFPALEHVIPEIQAIGQVVPVDPLIDAAFTKTRLQQSVASNTASIVHLATHGKFSSNPEETFILTFDDLLRGRELDNLVRSNHQRRSQPIELMVLSACETAQGDSRAALGLAGITLRAGSRSTLSTLWKADDLATATLMVRFYQELTQPNVTKAEALHRSQRSLFADHEQFKAPAIWAPYVLIGNWL